MTQARALPEAAVSRRDGIAVVVSGLERIASRWPDRFVGSAEAVEGIVLPLPKPETRLSFPSGS